MGRRPAALAFVAAAALFAALPAAADTLLVFAAASLREALDEAARAFESASAHRVRISYGASSALARQIEAGAPAQLFVSADTEWMQRVANRGLLKAPPVALLTNELVLVAPAGAATPLAVAPGFALAAALRGGRLAVADPASVPAGKYARAALESLGVWADVRSRLAPAENVRVALALVARAEAPLGIVYRTDAHAEPGVAIVGRFPASSHPAIVYPLGVLRGAPPAADARAIWRRHGFGPPR
jgi:molybdate transport system substrate-binding protein